MPYVAVMLITIKCIVLSVKAISNVRDGIFLPLCCHKIVKVSADKRNRFVALESLYLNEQGEVIVFFC